MNYEDYHESEGERLEREAYEEMCAALELTIRAYRTTWPDHCTRCGGWGMTSWTEAHGERFTEPCCECVADGICPRCGLAEIWLNDEGNVTQPCRACGWYNDEGEPSL